MEFFSDVFVFFFLHYNYSYIINYYNYIFLNKTISKIFTFYIEKFSNLKWKQPENFFDPFDSFMFSTFAFDQLL